MKNQAWHLPAFLNKLLNVSALALSTSVALLSEVTPVKALLLVGNTEGNNVVLFNETNGQFIREFISAGSGGLTRPDDLVFGPDGSLYISSGDGFTGKILRYNGKTGEFIDVFTSGGNMIRPYGIAFGPDGFLYVSSFLTDEILRYNAITGDFVDVFASGQKLPGAPRLPGELNGPNDLLFTSDGRLLVSTQGSIAQPGDYNGDEITSPGEFTASFTNLPSQILSYDISTGNSTVLIDQPTPSADSFGFVSFLGLALSSTGDLVTTDFANGIRIYNLATGTLIGQEISTNYTNPGGTANNFIGNLAFVGDTLYTVGFDFNQGNQGAILRYKPSTDEDGHPTFVPFPGHGQPDPVFVPTNSNLLRPIGIAYIASVPEPTATLGLLTFGAMAVIALRKRKSNPAD